jgi:quercetin dioxygenase-like cupin family protein
MPASTQPAALPAAPNDQREKIMSNRLVKSHLKFAVAAAALCLATAAHAVELDKSAVTYMTPDQFKWRDPSMAASTNSTTLYGDPTKTGGIYIYINKFKSGRFGNAHYHPNDRYITVIEGAGWGGTGPVVDPAQAKRLPKGSFRIDHANKLHWDGTKEETGAYLIAGIGPATNIEAPKVSGPYTGGDPSALTIQTPDQIQWKDNGGNRTANLVGDPTKEGMYVQMLTWKKGNGSRPHYHPNDRFFLVLDGTWWVGTGTKWDPANLTVPMKAGTFVTHHAKGVHWDGANGPNQDAETTIIVFGMGPATTTLAEPAK